MFVSGFAPVFFLGDWFRKWEKVPSLVQPRYWTIHNYLQHAWYSGLQKAWWSHSLSEEKRNKEQQFDWLQRILIDYWLLPVSRKCISGRAACDELVAEVVSLDHSKIVRLIVTLYSKSMPIALDAQWASGRHENSVVQPCSRWWTQESYQSSGYPET